MIDAQDWLRRYTPKPVKVIAASPQVRFARFSPCGAVLVAGGYDARVRRWSLASDHMPELPALAGHHAWVEACAMKWEGSRLYTGDSWGQLCCWENYAAEQPAVVWRHEQAHDGWLRDLSLSGDGKLLASCGSDRKIRIWSADDGQLRHEIPEEHDVLRVRFLPDGSIVAGDSFGRVHQRQVDGTLIRAFDASSLYMLHRLQDVGGIQALCVSADGKLLAAGGVAPKGGGTVTGVPTVLVFDVATGELKQRLELGTPNDCFVADLHWHAEGVLSVVTYGTPGQGQFLYVDPEAKAPLLTLKEVQNIHSLSWHPDGKRFIVAGTNSGSNGNGRPLDKEGRYVTNSSPLHVFSVPQD
jgi:WD40 repeat protein